VKRFVHVSRPAIIRNVKDGKNHPTVVIIDEEGKKYNYHAVVLRGPSALKYDSSPESIEANVFIVTRAGIEGYTDPDGDPPVMEVDVMEPQPVKAPRVSIWKKLRLGERWHNFWKATPIVGCMAYGDDR